MVKVLRQRVKREGEDGEEYFACNLGFFFDEFLGDEKYIA
jgi:hypothetical protein